MEEVGLFGFSHVVPCQILAAKILAWDLAALSSPTIWRENQLACVGWLGLTNYLASTQAA
jgi:hypothetical protein